MNAVLVAVGVFRIQVQWRIWCATNGTWANQHTQTLEHFFCVHRLALVVKMERIVQIFVQGLIKLLRGTKEVGEDDTFCRRVLALWHLQECL